MVVSLIFSGVVLTEDDYLNKVKNHAQWETELMRVGFKVKVGPLHFVQDKGFLGLISINGTPITADDYASKKHVILTDYLLGKKLVVTFDLGANYKKVKDIFLSDEGVIIQCENL